MILEEPDKKESLKLAENEYRRLESKFRLAQPTQGSFLNRAKATLMKQERVINILENQKEDLQLNLNVANSKPYRGLEGQKLTKVYNSIQREKQLDEEIINEKSRIKDLKTEIDNVKRIIIEHNKTDIHERKITESALKLEKILANLKDKLQVETTKFNDLVTENSHHRTEIRTLLKEREHFFKLYMQLYNNLLRGKQIIMDLTEQSTVTYNQRIEAYSKLRNLKEKIKAEKKIQSKEVQDLQRKLENSTDLYEFLSVKGQKRILQDLEAREAREKKTMREEMGKKFLSYLKILKKIMELSEEKSIDKFEKKFEKNESENIGLFNYLNEVNDEVNFLQDEVTSLLDRIDDQRALNEEREEKQKKTIKLLTDTFEAKQKAYEDALSKLNSSEILLHDLLFNIEKMFMSIECDSLPVLRLLGNNAHVNVFNVNLCLRLIEKNLYELIYLAFMKERFSSPEGIIHGKIVQEDYHIKATKRSYVYHIASISPCPLCVETDRIFILDENNQNDVLEGYDEMRKQLLEKIQETDMNDVLHNISSCRLPRSRAIIQARFQEQEHEKVEAANKSN